MIPRLLAVLAAAALASCSAFKTTYNNLDWIVDWQIGRYVDLEPAQKALLDDGFREFWHWHRGTQLSLYVKDLRELAQKSSAPMSARDIEDYMDRSSAHLARAIRELVPDAAKLLASFDDDQVREIDANLAKRRAKTAAETAGLTEDELRDKTERDMLRNLKRWVGPLSAQQKARVRRWAIERRYAGSVWSQYQQAWGNAFIDALQHRHEPDFEKRLAALFGEAKVPYRADLQQLQAENRRYWIALMSDLSASLDADQRGHLRQALLDLAADLETLAASP